MLPASYSPRSCRWFWCGDGEAATRATLEEREREMAAMYMPRRAMYAAALLSFAWRCVLYGYRTSTISITHGMCHSVVLFTVLRVQT